MDPKEKFDNSGEAFESDIAELYNIPEPKQEKEEEEKPE